MLFISYFTQLAYSLLQRYLSVSAFFNMKFMATDPYFYISFLELLLDKNNFRDGMLFFKYD